ncbi:Peroxisomal membrane protein MPV17 and related proteins [Ceraceosorus bombacis]|uniref:Peroxisomal membrane protein MPV17 and related proteins n=1 Tax=Ceraceosorus bombacis TaxID=401625 RepID=A0A0P1BLY0_9BASI|nr:Peroxisomal membrane protein MPV17 and related proteins [Ceraceosorus bombacis]
MSRFAAFYSRSFAQRPWLTLAVTNGGLSVVADALAQTFELSQAQKSGNTTSSSGSGFDLARSARFLAFGSAMAPLLAEWNKFIELKFPLRTGGPGSSAGHAKTGSGLPLNSHEMGKLGSPKGKGSSGAAARYSTAAAANMGKVSFLALGKRVIVDQGTFAPFGLALFVGFMGLMEGRDMAGIGEKFSSRIGKFGP